MQVPNACCTRKRGRGHIAAPENLKNLMFWNVISNVVMLCLFSCLQLCIQVLNFILYFARFFISIAEVKGSNPIQVRLSFRKFCKSCVYKVAMIILHLILHSAVHIYGFHIFKTYVYSVRCHKNLFEKYIQKEVKIGIFHAISGESQSDWDGWTVFFMWEEDKRTKYWRDVFIVDTT